MSVVVGRARERVRGSDTNNTGSAFAVLTFIFHHGKYSQFLKIYPTNNASSSKQPQNEYIEEHIKRHGRRLDYYERKRKREARAVHKSSAVAQQAFGLKAKILHAKRHAEKVQLKKTLKAHDERNVKQSDSSAVPDGALPTYLLDREGQKDAKALSSAIKQKRKDKAAKYAVPLPKVRGVAEDEMFKVIKTGKSKSKSWKRMVTKATFVGEGFTRKPVKMERFIRPMALRYKKANVTHPDLKATFQLQILGVKKNPQSPMYTQLGVLTKGTVIEVNVSELGMVTTGGKVVFGKYAQITNNPENDGCVNAVLRKYSCFLPSTAL
ncbi:ribosomal protein S8e-domain-containing protein [Melanogaster broomeanus]|nr:ribosomal protein S8e-domain-containing protein [Melanogaster broomeanus]